MKTFKKKVLRQIQGRTQKTSKSDKKTVIPKLQSDEQPTESLAPPKPQVKKGTTPKKRNKARVSYPGLGECLSGTTNSKLFNVIKKKGRTIIVWGGEHEKTRSSALY
eukprot:m.1822 g.1822  ORF g.1822 m.1822 type:complete len:107 (-) comp997_c0_seq1:295-615(-)